MLVYLFFHMMLLTYTSFERYIDRSREARQQIEIERAKEQEKQEALLQSNDYTYDADNESKPEVIRIKLHNNNNGGHMGTAMIRDVYNSDIMASGVVGLVGAPYRISYDEEDCDPNLEFTYDQDQLRSVPERNLIILHEGSDGFYVQVGKEDLDMENNTISVDIAEGGIYLLADRYEWYSCWGVDVSEYAYEKNPQDYASDWEREYDTGDILVIADTQWAMESAPFFDVYTPQQLAGAVYYVNAIAKDNERFVLKLRNDIDLEGYEWVPMGGTDYFSPGFCGEIDGQGHTIRNMKISTAYKYRSGFIGYSTDVCVHDINFENAQVSGSTYTGIVGGEIYGTNLWENINVSGQILQSGKDQYGSIIGREVSTTFRNCDAKVVLVDDTDHMEPLEYFSYRQELVATTPVSEDYEISEDENGVVTRTDDGNGNSLTWHVEVDGVQVLERNAENELSFNPSEIRRITIPKGSVCHIWLEAFQGETYIRVSNIIEYQYR